MGDLVLGKQKGLFLRGQGGGGGSQVSTICNSPSQTVS